MQYRSIWKKLKRVTALLLASVSLSNGWSQDLLRVSAAEGGEAYEIHGSDKSGDETVPDGLTVEMDQKDPESAISMSPDANEDGWRNQDTTFTVKVEAEDGAKPFRAGYKKDKDADYTWGAVQENDGEYTFSYTETDPVFNGMYWFCVEDELGSLSGEKSYPLKKDKVPPDTENIYIEYVSDSSWSEEEKPANGMIDFLKGVKRIFAKEKIDVQIYIRDEISGAKSLTYKLDGKSKTVECENGSTALVGGTGGYSIFRFQVTSTDPDLSGRLVISNVTDYAGNVAGEDQRPKELEGQQVLVVDNVAPAVKPVYENVAGVEEGIKYISSASECEDVQLVFTEAFYAKNLDDHNEPVKPVITVTSKDTANHSSGTFTEVTVLEVWSEFDPVNDQITAVLTLPYSTDEKGGEIEYKISVSYTDGSGNALTWISDEETIVSLDNKAPELVSCGIAGKTEYTVDHVAVYQNSGEGDVKMIFTVDDNAVYWNPDALIFKVINDISQETAAEYRGSDASVIWDDTVTGRMHTAAVAVHGEEDAAAAYHVEIAYEDKAGNAMETYTSDAFILDRAAPVLDIQYNEAYRLVKNGSGEQVNDKTDTGPEAGYTAYYKDDIQVSFTIDEQYAIPLMDGGSMNGLKDYVLTIMKDGTPMSELPAIVWDAGTQDDDTNAVQYTGKFTLTEEADYVITMSYADAAGNRMKDYTSETLILDRTAPVIDISYVSANTPGSSVLSPVNTNTAAGRNYFNEDVYLKIKVTDKNVRYHELKEVLSGLMAADGSDAPVSNRAETFLDGIEAAAIDRDGFIWYIPLTTEANYTIPVEYEDLAGNTARCDTQYLTVDKTVPVITKLEENMSSAGFKDAVNYKDMGYLFADNKLTVTVKTADQISGVWKLRFTVTDEKDGDTVVEEFFCPSAKEEYSIAIPSSGSDFKGTVKAEVLDWSANQSETSRRSIVESTGKHESTASAVITTRTNPSRTVDGEDYYNTDVKFYLTIKDTYSGIKCFKYTGGHTLSKAMDYSEEAGRDMENSPRKEITTEYSEDLTLAASSNNENNIKVEASFVDNTNHTKSVEQSYNIDITDPVITVEYDLEEPLNGRYYNQTRTAAVTIRERNFDEDDVEFTITNPDGTMPSISRWEHGPDQGDDTCHTCEVAFYADGDYTFGVTFKDMAGNEADYDRVDEFTIDQTKPVIQVIWDNHQALHEKYYAEARNAAIEVTEHNFKGSEVRTTITAANNGGAIVQKTNGVFSDHGDVHRAAIPFGVDGTYTMKVECTDLAGNTAEVFTEPEFVIDQTAPELEIFDIEDRSANNGPAAPGVRYSDTNYDAAQIDISLKGVNSGIRVPEGVTSINGDTVTLKLNDLAHIRENDDLYTLHVTVYDLAGNSADASVIFSVNRFGSVYVLDEASEDFLDRYYVNAEEDIIVTEINVDTLVHKEISYGRDGELVRLTEGTDYDVKVSGSDASWKSYEYTIHKENFETEGKYSITIYSEDRAANRMSNKANKIESAPIEFIIDKTGPMVVVTGIENNERYNADSRDVKVSVQDNITMSQAAVYLDGNENPEYLFDAEYLEKQSYEPVFTLGNAPRWQTVKVAAQDAAGNETTVDDIRVLITTNLWVRYINSPLAAGCTAAIAATLAGVFIILRKRRKKEEKAKPIAFSPFSVL